MSETCIDSLESELTLKALSGLGAAPPVVRRFAQMPSTPVVTPLGEPAKSSFSNTSTVPADQTNPSSISGTIGVQNSK